MLRRSPRRLYASRHRCHHAPHVARDGRGCVDARRHPPRGGVTRPTEASRVIPLFGRKVLPPRRVLPDLTDQDLEKMGVVLGDRRKILRAITGLVDGEKAAAQRTAAPLEAT